MYEWLTRPLRKKPHILICRHGALDSFCDSAEEKAKHVGKARGLTRVISDNRGKKHLMPLNWMQSYSSEQSKCRHLFCNLNELQLSCILTGRGDLMAQNRWNTGSQCATEQGKLNLGGRSQHTNTTSLLWLLLFFVVKKKNHYITAKKTVMFHCEFPLHQPCKNNNNSK